MLKAHFEDIYITIVAHIAYLSSTYNGIFCFTLTVYTARKHPTPVSDV